MKISTSLIMFIFKVFTNDGIFMLLDAQVEMTTRVAYLFRITRITLKFIHNAFWFTSEGFVSAIFKSSEIFVLVKTGCKT